MTDAAVLIPTHRHAALLPFALRSTLAQEGVTVEVLVVGGMWRTTGVPLSFLEDERVRFFDNPKGERHGEFHRHTALQRASGEIVCCPSDDDILLPDHALAMQPCSRTRSSRTARLSWSSPMGR